MSIIRAWPGRDQFRRNKLLLFPVVWAASMLLLLASDHAFGDGNTAAAQVALAQGRIHAGQGEFDLASQQWERAAHHFAAANDAKQEVAALTDAAAAAATAGNHRRARALAKEAAERAPLAGPAEQAAAWELRGILATLDQRYPEAERAFQKALALVTRRSNPDLHGSILNNLGNVLAAQERFRDARDRYQASVQSASPGSPVRVRALLNQARCERLSGQPMEADQTLSRAASALEDSRATAKDARLHLELGQVQQQADHLEAARRAYEDAAREAERTRDAHTRAQALLALGALNLERGHLDSGTADLRQAIHLAQRSPDPYLLYEATAALAVARKRTSSIDTALQSYRQAVEVLSPVRHELLLSRSGLATTTSSSTSINQLITDYADLLLQKAAREAESAARQRLLQEARQAQELLQSVELEGFFRDECVNHALAQVRAVDTIAARTAVVYILPLADRTELLVSVNGQGLQRFTSAMKASTLTSQVRQMRRALEKRTTYQFLRPAQTLHRALIEPITAFLETNRVHTLVFVPHGPLQLIPFAALHDGERFVVEHYATAITPGLNLLSSSLRKSGRRRTLVAGLTTSTQDFPPLAHVRREVAAIQALGSATTLLDHDFQSKHLQRLLSQENFSVVHIASHGQFQDQADETFLVTGDGRMSLNDLENLLRPSQFRGQPVELLVLSACQTAAGNERAALGLAGLALKSGARAALATLWHVNDDATAELVQRFYRELRQPSPMTKARALQQAQNQLLADPRYQHPAFWSPYLLIGNWL